MALLHWTTKQNKSSSLRFRLKLENSWKNKTWQGRMVSCCPAILLLSFCFSYHPNKKKREEKVQKQFLKRNDQNQCCPWNTIVVLDQKGTWGILASWCCRSAPSQAFILHACCLLQQTKSHITFSIAQAPTCDEARLWSVLLPSITRMNKKRYKCEDYELQKHKTDTKTFFLLL